MRNGADAWLRQTLDLLGFNAYFLLPVLTVGILLGWHHVLRQPWHVPRTVLYGMAGECLGLAVGLWLSWRLYQFLLQAIVPALGLSIAGFLGTISCYLGAGIYEELLFRLILLNLGIGLLAWMRAGRRASVIGGIVLTSLLFSAAHYVGPSRRPVSLVDISVPFSGRRILRRAVPLSGIWNCGRHARVLRRARRFVDDRGGAGVRHGASTRDNVAAISASPLCQEQMKKRSFGFKKTPLVDRRKSL